MLTEPKLVEIKDCKNKIKKQFDPCNTHDKFEILDNLLNCFWFLDSEQMCILFLIFRETLMKGKIVASLKNSDFTDQISMSDRKLNKKITELCNEGWISKIVTKNCHGSVWDEVYELNLEKIAEAPL